MTCDSNKMALDAHASNLPVPLHVHEDLVYHERGRVGGLRVAVHEIDDAFRVELELNLADPGWQARPIDLVENGELAPLESGCRALGGAFSVSRWGYCPGV